jgi:hypothetical protein
MTPTPVALAPFGTGITWTTALSTAWAYGSDTVAWLGPFLALSAALLLGGYLINRVWAMLHGD